MKFYLIRHGQTAWNAQHKVMGRTDVPLDSVGEAQAVEVGELMKSFHVGRIFTSPQLRAQQTAQQIALHHNLPVESDDRLCEMDFPRWVGKTASELKNDEVYLNRRKNFPTFSHAEVESFESLITRIKAFVREVEKVDGDYVVVSHSDVIRAMIVHMLNVTADSFYQFMIQNASCTILKKKNEKWILEVLNYSKDPSKKLEI